MKCLPGLRTSDKGFTLLELMVGIAMTLTIGGLALAALSDAQQGFTKDKNKIEDGQKLASVLELIGRDIRQAGEQINEPNFPVVKVVPDADSNKGARLIVYRAIEEALPVCSDIPAGLVLNNISVASTDANVRLTNPPCNVPSGTNYTNILQAWMGRRASGVSTSVLHDGQGGTQLFNYIGETNANSYQTLGLVSTPFNASTRFPVRSTIYLIEKREYLICDQKLKLRVNNNTEGNCDIADTPASPFQTIASNIAKLDIKLSIRNEPTAAQLAANPNAAETVENWNENLAFPGANPASPTVPKYWQSLQGVTVKISAIKSDNSSERAIASGKFYPRNALSSNRQ